MPAVENVSVFELGTTPLVTVTVPADCAPAVHALSVYTVYVTVPPAVEVAPVNVAESDAVPPVLIDEADSVVATDGAVFPTVNCSLEHTLEAALLFASPE